jgi:hypothetical protein
MVLVHIYQSEMKVFIEIFTVTLWISDFMSGTTLP